VPIPTCAAGSGVADGFSAEALAGLVERVSFHNPETGFCVLRVKARGQHDLITVVGHAASIAPGEWVQMSGQWVKDRTHGRQFRATFLKPSPPTSLEGIERYLASGLVRGIGPIYARKLVQAFGEAVFERIEQDPARLQEVAGISPCGRPSRPAPRAQPKAPRRAAPGPASGSPVHAHAISLPRQRWTSIPGAVTRRHALFRKRAGFPESRPCGGTRAHTRSRYLLRWTAWPRGWRCRQ